MNRKMSKRQRDIKSKLMAAICMLLVSSIMMVSTTYAWFTLSTAPEVTGISTAVGANGNLEMALLNPELQGTDNKLISGWGDAIQSGTSDSMDAANKLKSEANITWGNLVDVSDDNTYGLNNINLYPAQLATEVSAEGKTTIKSTPLSRPVFGADGRVAELKADTLTASYASGTFSLENKYGVRAVGTSSSMTARELAHRAALSSAATASSLAKGAASGTLQTNGNVLASMAITHVGDANATFTYAQVNTLKTVVTALKTAHTHIEDALKWYVVAHNIAPDTESDATYLAKQEAIRALPLADIAASTTYSRPAGFDDTGSGESLVKGAYSTLVDSQAKVTEALGTLDTLLSGKTDSDTFTWGQFSSALNAIMDYDSMELNGLPMDDVKETDDKGNFINASVIINAMGKEGLQLQMGSGSGVFADIADFCGTYTASIVFPADTSVMGVNIGGVEATMTTNAPKTPTWLADIRSGTNSFAGSENAAATKSITDFYGYIIDLGFRTNASGSHLLLQADATDRIYGADGKNEETMGHGSTMTFTATDVFGVPMVQSLMGSLRIVFFYPDSGEIIGYARLNPATASIEGSNVTMKMGMWDIGDGTATAGAFKTGDGANQIVELTQNTAQAISVLVYLDGTSVTNKDVAATGTQSMTGTMNLQFASDANLAPMEYADLKDGKSSTGDSGDTSAATAMTAVSTDQTTSKNGISVGTAYYTTTPAGFGVVLNGTLPANPVVTATIGSETVTGTAKVLNGVRGYWFSYSDPLAADTAVSISVTQGTAPTYTVSKATGSDATVTLENITYSSDARTITFTLGNTDAGKDYTVTHAGTTLTPSTGTYTINNVTADTEVTVTATAKTYTVTINGSQQETRATHGADYEFTAAATPTVTVGGNSVTATQDATDTSKYTIAGTDVTGAIDITFTTE